MTALEKEPKIVGFFFSPSLFQSPLFPTQWADKIALFNFFPEIEINHLQNISKKQVD